MRHAECEAGVQGVRGEHGMRSPGCRLWDTPPRLPDTPSRLRDAPSRLRDAPSSFRDAPSSLRDAPCWMCAGCDAREAECGMRGPGATCGVRRAGAGSGCGVGAVGRNKQQLTACSALTTPEFRHPSPSTNQTSALRNLTRGAVLFTRYAQKRKNVFHRATLQRLNPLNR